MRTSVLLLSLALAACAAQPTPAGSCADGVKGGSETDVDCGGGCAPCATRMACAAAKDCRSGICTEGRCLDPAPTCTDGKRNDRESDVDCGGGCAACTLDQACAQPTDCATGACDGGRCVPGPVITAVAPDRGPTTGGAAITISGEHFRAGAIVSLGGAATTVQSVSDKQIVFTLPESPGKVGLRDLTVVNPGGGAATRRDALRYYYGRLQLADKVDYPTGAEPRGQLLADLDGDGALDVVTTHRSAGTVVVHRGKGDGTLLAGAPYGNGGLASTLAIADLNGDKKLDVATASVTAVGVSLLPGGGDGTLGAAAVTPVGDLLRLTGGDLNGDGEPDLILGLRNASNGVRALLGKGDGGFTTTALTSTPEQIITILTGDLNKDGKLDVIASQTGAVLVILGNGDGTLRAPVSYSLGVTTPPQAFTLADLDGDGDLDVIAAVFSGAGLSVLLNKGDGTLGAAALLQTPGNSSSGVAAADLDGDGAVDLVASNSSDSSVGILRGKGDGTFASPISKPTGRRPLDVNLGDLDRDGRLDIVVSNDTDGTLSVLRAAFE